ncbi:hypothetical protein LHV18_15605 [Providencia rettgeri]|uniref:hypothetical protein n=1 Tax=Providencia rettgeri TaxID=587 RepID=UPI001CFE02C1|nr:hypothetical protein [Providencia rettgeri]EIU7558125.1 hypothetical protein [Providencia rettgeri]MCB4842051.1 hypothetical protein [Providencia rettgeri]
MAKNEFLPFGIAEGANVLSNQEYERLAARFNGFISGVAKSKELNTVWRQSSVMSSALAQFIVDSDNKDLLDNGDVASIKTRLVAAVKQTISGVGYVTTAAMNLELNKKIDKANISGQKGNDNDKVPSLNLFTTEIGKLAALGYSYSKIESDGRYQPKGNYAPAGDYATNTALNNGLNGKLDKTVVVQDVGTSTTKVMSQDASFKKFMKFGDYGFGSLSAVRATNSQLMSSLQSQLFRMGGGSDDNAFVNHGAGLLISYSSSIRAGLFIDDANGDLTVFRSRDNIASGAIRKNKVYTDGNTATDRNGYLRVVSSVEELVGVPVGGSILWNGVWDENSPLAEYFWPNEGRSFSAVAYPVAAKVFPSLRLPDDRGYAIRIADNGRGIDPGRTVGTYQEDAMQKIEGTLGPLNDRAISYTGAFYGKSKTGSNAGINGGGQENVAGFDSSRVVRTANETRMKNVAKILITRMK